MIVQKTLLNGLTLWKTVVDKFCSLLQMQTQSNSHIITASIHAVKLGPNLSEKDWGKLKRCAVVWWVHMFLEIMDVVFRLKKKRAIQVQKPASVMIWACVSTHGMYNLHICVV